MNEVCHVVLLTPPARGAVATLLIAGADAAERVARHFRPAAKAWRDFRLAPLGRIVFGRFGGKPSEEIVACRTAEDRVELHCHGGRAAAERITALLADDGCLAVDWSPWLSISEPDVLRREAIWALSQATTERAASILLDQHEGALRTELEILFAELTHAQGLDSVVARLQALHSLAPLGLHLTRPWQVVLAGRPNVGKSSLINALVGFRRAIVFDQPGTTRDVVTALTALDGWPVELADTAGLHASEDSLEQAGMELARGRLSAADCILLVFDGSQPWRDGDDALLAEWPQAMAVHNKSDLPAAMPRRPGFAVSAATGAGIPELMAAVVAKLMPRVPQGGAAVPFATRQVELLNYALQCLERSDRAAAISALQQLLVGANFNSLAHK